MSVSPDSEPYDKTKDPEFWIWIGQYSGTPEWDTEALDALEAKAREKGWIPQEVEA